MEPKNEWPNYSLGGSSFPSNDLTVLTLSNNAPLSSSPTTFTQ